MFNANVWQKEMSSIRTILSLTEKRSNCNNINVSLFPKYFGRSFCQFRCVQDNINLVIRALRGQMIIPDWQEFCHQVEPIYSSCRINPEGKVSLHLWCFEQCHCRGYCLSKIHSSNKRSF